MRRVGEVVAPHRLGLGTLACVVLGLAAVLGCYERDPEVMKIYADADWYVARVEPEEVWRGVLREHRAPVGPGTRGGLTYVLVTKESELQVYAPHAERLTRFVGHEVSARGKLVDLGAEGFGRELWLGSIAMAGS